MTTIIDVLKSDEANTRITVGYRWLFWDQYLKEWVVCERKPYARTATEIITTEIEAVAVRYLLD